VERRVASGTWGIDPERLAAYFADSALPRPVPLRQLPPSRRAGLRGAAAAERGAFDPDGSCPISASTRKSACLPGPAIASRGDFRIICAKRRQVDPCELASR